MDRVLSKRKSAWNLVNIKARRNQTTEHYVRTFKNLYNQDPMVGLPRGGKSASLKHMACCNLLDENENPKWVQLELLSYTIIDQTAFYNRRRRENVSMDNWDEDIVANKKEVSLYFIPQVHMLVVRRNADISLKNIVYYLKEALNRVEPETFDVDVIVERDILDRILNAHVITKIYANISYSNPGHTSGFKAVFDEKLRGMDASRVEITATGTKDNPIKKDDDGMLQAMLDISERNGYVRATIQLTESSKMETIDSSEHPRTLIIPQIINDVASTIYNTVISLFGNRNQ